MKTIYLVWALFAVKSLPAATGISFLYSGPSEGSLPSFFLLKDAGALDAAGLTSQRVSKLNRGRVFPAVMFLDDAGAFEAFTRIIGNFAGPDDLTSSDPSMLVLVYSGDAVHEYYMSLDRFVEMAFHMILELEHTGDAGAKDIQLSIMNYILVVNKISGKPSGTPIR